MADSQYAYFCCSGVLYRVKIEKEFKIELVSSNLPMSQALFNHRHTIYSVGGREGLTFVYSRRMYIFDTRRFHQLPIENLECLEKSQDFEPMVEPRVIRGAEDRIYLLSVKRRLFQAVDGNPLCFQSFDPIKDCFETLAPPPLPTDHDVRPNVTLAHFFLREYIYLFIFDRWNAKYLHQAFTFNTRSSEWKERMSLLDRFEKKKIPPPFGHNGNIGLSVEFQNDKTRILVAFYGTQLSAYRVKIHADGDLEPISYRFLKESCYPEGRDDFATDLTRLADIGGGKFCVVTGSYSVDLLIYVFQIDFELEHHIQSSASGVGASSSILFYKKFQLGDKIEGFCIVQVHPDRPHSFF